MRTFTLPLASFAAAIAVASCANVVDEPSTLSGHGRGADTRALVSADVKKYVVNHNRSATTSEMADIGGEASAPFAGVAWPGGAQGDIAEPGKPLQIVYEPVE